MMTESEVQTVTAGPALDHLSHTVNISSAGLNLENLQIDYNAENPDGVAYLPNMSESESDDEEDPDPIMAFAMLKFTDGKYFMKTMSLLVGRDMVAYRAALLDSNAWALRHGTEGQQDTFIYEVLHQQEPQGPASKSSSAGASPNANGSNGSNEAVSPSGPDIDALKALPEDPSTDECPFLAIHQPKEFGDPLPSGSSISRRHAQIVFNTGTGHFEIVVLGKNGLFVNQEYLPMGEKIQLNHRDHVQIAAIEFDFFLPSGGDGDDEEAGPDSVSGRMSFAFEDASGEQVDVAVGSDDENSWRGHGAKFHHNVYYESYNSSEGAESGEEGSGEEVDDEDGEEDSVDEEEGEGEVEDGDEDEMEQDEQDVDEDEEEVESDEPEPEPKAATRVKLTSKRGRKIKVGRVKSAKRPALSKMKPATGGKRPLKTNAKNGKPNGKSQPTKLKGKAPVKEVEAEEKDDKDDKKDETPVARIARDEPLQNGDGVEIVGLPIGVTIPARRKGPGRPPKDGIMSKRERQLLIRQWREQEKAKKLGLDPSTIVIPEPKKTGRPRKNSKGEEMLDDGENGMKDGDELERKKVVRPPRSPSPQMKEADYNEEQLSRPSGNYVIFIYEAIMASAEKKLNLQQIYSAIERKYPYFKFRVNTPGWQSSVRHNLGQHPAFEKVEKDGKGYLWGIKEGVPIDRERKKRSPPPPSHPYSYPAPQYSSMPNGAIPSHYGMHAHHNPPPRQPLVPPSLAHSAATTRPTSYSSPYATANHRPTTTPAPHPTYANPSQDQSSSKATPKPQPYQQTFYPPVQRPSQDVIETFVSVFKKSFQDNRKAIDMAAADRIVNNAVKRVLEPHTMVNVPSEESEQSVVDAFRRCLERSQGPPRQALPATTPLAQIGTAPNKSTPPAGLGILTGTLLGSSIPRSTTPPDPVRTSSGAPLPSVTATSSSAPPKASELHTMLAEQLSSVNGRNSPQRPAVEPLTPPTGQARAPTPIVMTKRTIDEVEQPEVSASKKLEVESAGVEV